MDGSGSTSRNCIGLALLLLRGVAEALRRFPELATSFPDLPRGR